MAGKSLSSFVPSSKSPHKRSSVNREQPGARVSETKLFAGRYRLDGIAGRGGMGVVHRAFDTELNEWVAVKILTIGDLPGATKRFLREVKLARRVTHRNVARTYDVGRIDQQLFLTMEWINGKTLARLIDTETIPTSLAVEILLQICDGLAAAHAVGVIHRDLKPCNIMLECTANNGDVTGGSTDITASRVQAAADAGTLRAVVTDFGIATAPSCTRESLTNGSFGSPDYMSPEQVQGGPIGPQSDIYSFGCLAFELLSGIVPFQGNTPVSVAMARLLNDAPDLGALTKAPRPLCALIGACLARNADERPATISDVARQLRSPGLVVAPTIPNALAATDTDAEPIHHASTDMSVTVHQQRPQTRIVVLPCRYRGPEDHEHLADALTDELADLLSSTRGLKIIRVSPSPTALADDPKETARKWNAEIAVSGSVSVAGNTVRVAARLMNVRTGEQLWSDRLKSEMEDLLSLPDRLARKIAESLRVELTTQSQHNPVPREAIDLYFRARHKLRMVQLFGPDGAVALFSRCKEIAPLLQVAHAGYAMACVRAWSLATNEDAENWRKAARDATAAAVAEANDLSEVNLAAAILAMEEGSYQRAKIFLKRALRIAPAYPEAIGTLGRLEVEVGQFDEGVAKLELALDLAPELTPCAVDLARCYTLRGDKQNADRVLAKLSQIGLREAAIVVQFELRMASWTRDQNEIRRVTERVPREGNSPAARLLMFYVNALMGQSDLEKTSSQAFGFTTPTTDPRWSTFVHQLAVECFLINERQDLAIEHLKAACDTTLIDVGWMDLCPILEPIREHPVFCEVRRAVRARANEVVYA